MGLIRIVKETGDREALAVGGTELTEERAVAWWEPDTQRRLGFRDGRFRGAARNPLGFKKFLRGRHLRTLSSRRPSVVLCVRYLAALFAEAYFLFGSRTAMA